MAYGTIKIDTITFTDGGIDKSVAISGLVQNPTFTGNVTVTGTISGNTVRGQTISGVTVTGTTANFTSGNFTNISGGTHTITSGVFASGTAANPSISFVSDPNSGLYSPGADQVAISTNGTGRLFVASNGNVGVGRSSSINERLSVQDTGLTSGTVGANIVAGFRSNAANADVSIALTDGVSSSAQFGQIAGSLYWYTNGAERMRLDTSGRLGLGTSVPGATLEVAGSSYPNFVSNRSLSSGGSGAAGWTAARIQATTTEQMSAGFGVQQEFALRDADGVDNVVANLLVSRDGADNSGSFAIRTASAGTLGTRLHITSGGSVGIGTTTVSTKLHIVSNGAGGDVWVANGSGQNCLLEMAGNGNTPQTNSALYGQDASNNVYAGWARGAHPVLFGTNGTEKGRWDSSGRFLVGTSSSASAGDSQYSKLQIRGNTSGNPQLGIISIQRDEAASAITTGEGIGEIVFTDNAGNTFAAVVCEADATAGSGDYPGRLTFSTTADGASSPTEAMRIRNNRAVWIDVAAAADSLIIGSREGAGTSYKLIGAGHSGSSIGNFTESFQVFTNGNVRNTNNSYAGISDIKLKENVVDAPSQWLDVKAFQVRKYNFKEETGQQTHTQIGLIAQEVELVSPGLVTESPDRDADGNDLGTVTKSVNYSVLYMKAVKALQEAMERIETLEAKVAALEGV